MASTSPRLTRNLLYEPLATQTHIRLLRRLNSDDNGLIPCPHFYFESYDLPSSPEFTALSYTWGSCMESEDADNHSDEKVYTVECNGQLCSVTENLFDFLSTIMQDFLWIDALCINQQDNDEKAIQVSLMGQIYAAANIVIMWLGKDTSDLSEFLFLHDKFLPELDNRDIDVFKQSIWDLSFIREIGIESAEQWRSYWTAYYRFYQRRRFFYRAWIVQEYVLGRRQIFFCGGTALHPNQMIRLLLYINNSAWGQDMGYLDLDFTKQTNPMSTFLSVRGAVFDEREDSREFQVTQGGLDGAWLRRTFESVSGAITPEARWFCFLSLLIDRVRPLSATDPRDKIYSILGLANLHLPKSLPRSVHPNYHIAFQEVYTSVSGQIAQSIPFLTVLSYVHDLPGRRNKGLPSWVPDYTYSSDCKPLVWLGEPDVMSLSGDETEHTQPISGGLYNASLANASSPSFREFLGDALVVTGAYFDKVEDVSDLLEKVFAPGGIFSPLNICGSINPVYKATGQSRTEALWRTLIADFHNGKHPAPQDISGAFRDYVMWILCHFLIFDISESQLLEGQHEYLKILDLLSDSDPSLVLPKSTEVLQRAFAIRAGFQEVLRIRPSRQQTFSLLPRGQADRFDQTSSQTMVNRSLYRTSNGYLGLGPASAQKGDEIWLINGALVPFIMRRQVNQEALMLVGESYLHGFMHGEMLTPELRTRINKVHIV